jgi:hypothetical protein
VALERTRKDGVERKVEGGWLVGWGAGCSGSKRRGGVGGGIWVAGGAGAGDEVRN